MAIDFAPNPSEGSATRVPQSNLRPADSRLLRRGDHPEPNEAAEHPVSVNGEGWWVVCPTVLSFDAGAFPSAPSGT